MYVWHYICIFCMGATVGKFRCLFEPHFIPDRLIQAQGFESRAFAHVAQHSFEFA